MQEIKDWLNDPDKTHQQGYELLCKYSKNRMLKNRLKSTAKWAFNKLVYELNKLVERAEQTRRPLTLTADRASVGKYAKPSTTKKVARQASKPKEQRKPAAIELSTARHIGHEPEQQKQEPVLQMEQHQRVQPPQIIELKVRLSELKTEETALRSGLTALRSDRSRKVSAFRILAIGEERKDLFKKLDHWTDTGELPAMPKQPPITKVDTTDLAAVLKRINTLRTYISREKGKPSKAHLLEKHTKEKEYLENLNNNSNEQ